MTSRRALMTFVAACGTVCIMTPSVALAANTTCVNADFVALGQAATGYTIAASGSLFYKVRLTAGRSKNFGAWAPFQDAGEGGVSLGTDAFSDSACTTVAPGGDATDYEPILDADSHATDTNSLVPTTSGTFYIRITNVLATAYTINFIVVETTLFSPWWFTSGSNAAFVEVRNNISASTTAHLTFYRADGAVCGTSSVIVAGNGNTTLSIGALGTARGIGFCSDILSRDSRRNGGEHHHNRRRERHVFRLAVHATNGLGYIHPVTKTTLRAAHRQVGRFLYGPPGSSYFPVHARAGNGLLYLPRPEINRCHLTRKETT